MWEGQLYQENNTKKVQMARERKATVEARGRNITWVGHEDPSFKTRFLRKKCHPKSYG